MGWRVVEGLLLGLVCGTWFLLGGGCHLHFFEAPTVLDPAQVKWEEAISKRVNEHEVRLGELERERTVADANGDE
jgi:hypothetical protein